jgi:protein involved in polysaccharide export with SLBB domain
MPFAAISQSTATPRSLMQRPTNLRSTIGCPIAGLVILFTLAMSLSGPAMSQPRADTVEPQEGNSGGPIRLRQPAVTAPASVDAPAAQLPVALPVPATPYRPGEFELFVQRQAGTEVRRLGSELMAGGYDGRASELSPLVPADYIVAPGDEVLVTLWGSVDADMRLIVDREGRINIPRVGTVQIAGVRHADLQDMVSRRVAQVFRNFQLSVTLGQLRGIRVFVTGQVARPGTYTVTSLSTVVSALMRAGGPTPAGSFRNIALWRGKQLVGSFDLYDLLTRGDRSADRIVQAGDVVHVAAVGEQVAVIGSVNQAAVIEIKPGETIADAIGYAGGFSAVADRNRVAIERLQDRHLGHVQQVDWSSGQSLPLAQGDILRAFSVVELALPLERQNKRVKVEGEVYRPAEYVLPEGSSLGDAIRAAGGLTNAAFVYAAEFTRTRVQKSQQESYDRALRDLETDIVKAGTQRSSVAEDSTTMQARNTANSRVIDRMRALRPTGRIVLNIPVDATSLPDIALEDGDRILVPSRPTTVGVFGSIFNAASYLYSPNRTLNEYLRLAGGPTRGADERSIFVVRANGSVVSNRQGGSGWLSGSGDIGILKAEPGDTIFVPEELDKSTFIQSAKDWTQILYQFGLGIAGIKTVLP